MPPFVILIFAGIVTLALSMRFAAGGLDRDRVQRYIASQGGAVHSIQWAPFGRGWFGSQNERIYLIDFTDRGGNRHRAWCKTSLFSGVYFTDEQEVDPNWQADLTQARDDRADLRSENQRLAKASPAAQSGSLKTGMRIRYEMTWWNGNAGSAPASTIVPHCMVYDAFRPMRTLRVVNIIRRSHQRRDLRRHARRHDSH